MTIFDFRPQQDDTNCCNDSVDSTITLVLNKHTTRSKPGNNGI
jgi:hypothetical protein